MRVSHGILHEIEERLVDTLYAKTSLMDYAAVRTGIGQPLLYLYSTPGEVL